MSESEEAIRDRLTRLMYGIPVDQFSEEAIAKRKAVYEQMIGVINQTPAGHFTVDDLRFLLELPECRLVMGRQEWGSSDSDFYTVERNERLKVICEKLK